MVVFLSITVHFEIENHLKKDATQIYSVCILSQTRGTRVVVVLAWMWIICTAQQSNVTHTNLDLI